MNQTLTNWFQKVRHQEVLNKIKVKEEKRITDILNYLTSPEFEASPLRYPAEEKARDKLNAYEADLNARHEA